MDREERYAGSGAQTCNGLLEGTQGTPRKSQPTTRRRSRSRTTRATRAHVGQMIAAPTGGSCRVGGWVGVGCPVEDGSGMGREGGTWPGSMGFPGHKEPCIRGL